MRTYELRNAGQGIDIGLYESETGSLVTLAEANPEIRGVGLYESETGSLVTLAEANSEIRAERRRADFWVAEAKAWEETANEISDRRDKLAKINSELRSKLLDLLDLCQFADFDNGVEEFGMNEGRTKAYENISEIETYLRQLDGGINGNANKTTDGK